MRFIYALYDVGTVSKIGVGEHDKIAAGFKKRGPYRAALAAVLCISGNTDVRQPHGAHYVGTSVCTAIVRENYFVIIKICAHVFRKLGCRSSYSLAFIVHRYANRNFHFRLLCVFRIFSCIL